MDELNLYDDLDDFQEQQEKKSKELQEVEEKYQKALKTIEELQNENKTLKKNIQRMELGFQSLLDTARTEIKRKDKEIERLRKENDDICFRRKIPHRSTVEAAEKPYFRHHSSVENPFKMNTKDYKETALTKDSKVTSESEKLDNPKRARCQDNERDHSNDHKRYRSSRDDYKYKNSTKSREDVKDSRSYYNEKDKDHNSRSVRNRSSERKDYDKPSSSRAQRRSSNSPENYNKRSARSQSREHDNKSRHERNRSRERKNVKESPKKSSKSPTRRIIQHIETKHHDDKINKIETSFKTLDKKDNGNPKSEDLKEKNQNKTLKIVEDREQQEQSNSKKIICNLYNSKKQDSEETSIKESTGKTSKNSQLNQEAVSNDEILKSKDLKTQKDVLRKESNADHEIKCQYENVRKTVTGETSSLCSPRKVALFEELFGESPKETIRSKSILSKSAEMACSSSTTTSPGDYTDISSNLSTPKGNEIIEISSSNSSIYTNRDINDNKSATKMNEKVVDKGNDIDECFIPNQHVKENVKTIASVDLTEVIDDDLANEIEYVQIPGLDLCPRKINRENINSNHKTETIATTNLLTDNNFWNIKSSTADDSQRNVCNDSKHLTDLKQMDNVNNSVRSSKTMSVTNLCTAAKIKDSISHINKEMETLKAPQSLTLKDAVKVLPENQQEDITKCSEEFDLQDNDNILNDVVVIETAKLGSIPPLKNPYTEENALEENYEIKTKSKNLDFPAVSELEIGYKSSEKQQSESIDIVKGKQKNVCDETLSSKKNSLEDNNTVNMTTNVTKSKIEQNLDVENSELCPSTADIITSEELSTEINSADKEKSDDETANSEKDNVSSLSTTEITTCGEKVEFPLITSEMNSAKTLEKETEAKSDDDKIVNETEILEKDNISSSACESTNKEIVKENVALQEKTSSISEEQSHLVSEIETTKDLTHIDESIQNNLEQIVINSESKLDPNISSEEEQTTLNLCPQIDVNKESNVEETYKNNLDVENLDENDTSQHEKTTEYDTAKIIKINDITDEITCSEKEKENDESTDKVVTEGNLKIFENEISLGKNCETIVATNIDSDNDLNSQDPSNSFINNTRDDNNLCCTAVQESSTAVCLSNVIENKTIEESSEEINDEISELKDCASEDQILESAHPNKTDDKIKYSAEKFSVDTNLTNKSLESTVEIDDEGVNDENLITINSKDSIESAEELNAKSQPNIFKNNEIILEENLKTIATTTIDFDNELNLQNETEAVRESPSKVSISNNVENKTLRIKDTSEDINDKDEISEPKDCASGDQILESDNTNNTDDNIKNSAGKITVDTILTNKSTLTFESPANTDGENKKSEVTENSSKAVNDDNCITINSKDTIEVSEKITTTSQSNDFKNKEIILAENLETIVTTINSDNELNLQDKSVVVQESPSNASTSNVVENKTMGIRDSSEDMNNETSAFTKLSEILESDNVNKTDEKVSSSASKTTVDILTSKSALSLEYPENSKTVVPNRSSKEVNYENLITIDPKDETHILETDDCETTTYSLEVKKNALVEENLNEDATQNSPTETSCSSTENNKKIISSTAGDNYDSLKEITALEEKIVESALIKDSSSETSTIESCSSSNRNDKVIGKEGLEEKMNSFDQTPEKRCPLIATSTIDISEKIALAKDDTSTEMSCDSTVENTNLSTETRTLPVMKTNKTASSKDSSFKTLPMDIFHSSENNEVTEETLDTSIKISTHSIENVDSSSKKWTIEVCDSHETNVKNNSLKVDYHKVPLEETSVILEEKIDESVMNNDSLIETSIMELSDSPEIHDEVISLNSEGNKCSSKETTIEQEKENNHLKITNDTEVNTKTVSIISDDNNVSTNTAQEQEKTYDTASTKDSSSTETTESFGSPQTNEKSIESTTEENGNFSKENSTLLEKNGAEAVLTTDFPTENLTVVLCASPETNEKSKSSVTKENFSKDTSTHSEQKIEMSKNTSNNACEVAVERKHEPTITNDSSVETIEICDSPETRATIVEGLVSLTPEESKDSSKKTGEVRVEKLHETQLTKDSSIETIELCDSPERRDTIKEGIVSLTPENIKDSSKEVCEVPTEKIKESTLVKDSSIERIEMCDSPETRVSLTPEKSKDSTKQACEVSESALMKDSSIEPIEICDSPETRDTMKEEIESLSPEKSKDSSKESCEAPVEKIHESSFTKDSSIEPIEICDSPETRDTMKEEIESLTPEICKDISKAVSEVSVDKIQESTLGKDSSIETIEICDSPETREGMKEEIESLNSEKSKDISKKACEVPLEKIQDSTLTKDSSIETIEICDSHETREIINEGLVSLKNKDSSKEDSSIEAVEICDSPETNENMKNLSPDENKVYSKENHVETEKNENKLAECSTITLSPLIRSDSTENNLKIIELDSDESKDSTKQTIVSNEENYDNALTNATLPSVTASKDNILTASNINKTKSNVLETFEDSREGSNKTIKNTIDSETVEKVQTINVLENTQSNLENAHEAENKLKDSKSTENIEHKTDAELQNVNLTSNLHLNKVSHDNVAISTSDKERTSTTLKNPNESGKFGEIKDQPAQNTKNQQVNKSSTVKLPVGSKLLNVINTVSLCKQKTTEEQQKASTSRKSKVTKKSVRRQPTSSKILQSSGDPLQKETLSQRQTASINKPKCNTKEIQPYYGVPNNPGNQEINQYYGGIATWPHPIQTPNFPPNICTQSFLLKEVVTKEINIEGEIVEVVRLQIPECSNVIVLNNPQLHGNVVSQVQPISIQKQPYLHPLNLSNTSEIQSNVNKISTELIPIKVGQEMVNITSQTFEAPLMPYKPQPVLNAVTTCPEVINTQIGLSSGKNVTRSEFIGTNNLSNKPQHNVSAVESVRIPGQSPLAPLLVYPTTPVVNQTYPSKPIAEIYSTASKVHRTESLEIFKIPEPKSVANQNCTEITPLQLIQNTGKHIINADQQIELIPLAESVGNNVETNRLAAQTTGVLESKFIQPPSTTNKNVELNPLNLSDSIVNNKVNTITVKKLDIAPISTFNATSSVVCQNTEVQSISPEIQIGQTGSQICNVPENKSISNPKLNTTMNNKLTIQVSSNACKISETQEANEKVDNEQNKCTSSQVSVIKSTLNEKIIELRPLENHEISKNPSTLNVQDAVLNPSKTCQIIRSRAVETTVDKNQNEQAPLKMCNVSESPSNAKENVETNEITDIDVSQNEKETQHAHQKHDKEEYKTNIQQKPLTCPDKQKPAININSTSEVPSTSHSNNIEQNPLEISENNRKVQQELPKEVFQFQIPQKIQTSQTDLNAKAKIVPEQDNVHRVNSTLPKTYNTTHIALPSISTNSPTPSNFSGIFSKKSSTLTVEEDNKKSHKKSPQFKPREYVLPAASVLCNMDNLENATKATKKLHWELLEGKNEQTEIEDDADIASTDEEALIIKEEPLDNASTSPKQSNLGDQPTCSKSQKSSPSETDTQTEDESLLNELRRQRGTLNHSSVVIPLKVHKLKQRKHKLPKNVKVKLKTLSRDTIESFKDTSLITQMPFSIVFPKRPVGRPRKVPDMNKKHKVEIIKQHKKRGRKPKNKPQEVNKCIILESKLDKSKELPMETLEDVCETQTNLLEYLKVRSKVVVNKQKQELTINNNNERITEDLENNIENSVKILSTSVERLEICDEPCTSKESVKQLKSFDKQIDDFKYDDDHNTSMIYHKLDSSTDYTNISQQENSSQEWNSNLESKETGKNRYREIPPDKSNSTKLDAVKKHQEWPSCSRVIQENTFSSVECTLRSDTDTDKVSSDDPSRDTRKEKSHKTRKLKKSLMKKKLKTKMKVKNKVTTFISLEDIGIKVKPLKAHLSTFRIPKIKKDHEESIANSWKLESYIENIKEKEKDKETTDDEKYKESAKDKKQEQQEKQKSPKKKLANDIENVEISTASNSAEKATKDNQSETPSNFIINFDNKPKTGKRKLFSPDIYEEQVNENTVELPPDTTKSETVNETCLYLSKTHEPNPVKLRRKSLHFPIRQTTSPTNYSEKVETSSSSNYIKPPKKSLNIHRRILDDSTEDEDDGKRSGKIETKTQTKPSSLIVNEENNSVKKIKESSSAILNKKDTISTKSSAPEIDLTASSANDLSNKKSLGNRRKSMCVEKISPELKETNAIEKVKPNIPKRRKSMYVERPPSTCSELEENEEKNPNKDGIERISPELQEKCALVNVKQRRKSMHVERSSPASNEIEETDNSKSTKVTVNRTSPVLKEKTKIESVKDDIPRRRKSMYVESSPPVSNEMGNTEIPKSREIVVKKISPEPKETDELAKVKQNISKRRKSMYVERPPSASSEVEEIETSKLRKGDVERISPELKERSDNDKVIDKISKRRKSMYIERPPSTSSEMEEIESFKTKKVGDKKITPETIEIDEPISKKQNLPKRRKSMYVERPTLESNEIEKSETSKTKKDIVGTISTNIESTNQNLPKRRKSMYVERPPSASSEMEETETRISGKVVVERESPDLKVTKESQNIKQNIPERRKSMYVEKSSSEKTQSHKIDNIKDINESKQSTPTANSKIDENINKNEEVPKTIMSLKMRRKSMYSETASTSKVVPSKTNGSPKEASNVSNHTQIETIKDANQIAENPTMLCKPQQETDDKTRESPKPIVSLKMRRKSMYLERQEKEKIDEINKTKKDLDKQTQSSISQATEINEKNNDFIELNKNLSQKPTNKEVIENTIPKKEKTKDLYKTKPEVTKKLEDSKVDKQRDLSIQPNKIRRKSTYQEHLIDNENSLLNREIENKPKQNLDEKSAVTKSDTEQSKLDLDSSTKITQEITIKLHRKFTNQRSLAKEERNKSKDSLERNHKDHVNPQEKQAVERESSNQLENSEHKEVRPQKLKNDVETTSSKHVDVITTEKSIKLRRKSTNQSVNSGAGTNDELDKNSDIAVASCAEEFNSKPEVSDTRSFSKSSTKLPQTVSQETNEPDSDSSMIMSQENSIKLRRKSTNQRRILDSSSDDDNEPLIKKPTVISNEIKTPLTTANKTKSRRKRVVKVLSTSLESPTNPSHTSHQSSCSASPLTSPTLNHPIFNREVPSSEFAASMPMTPNQQDDNKFKEIDSKLHAIFQSPQYTVDYKISPAVDGANLAILPPPSYEAQPDVCINETQDINQENDQSSINLTQINESSMCLNDTISASTSHNNSEVKHLCLGSSEYRIEKVNDNVINLFISRKRKRKRTN